MRKINFAESTVPHVAGPFRAGASGRRHDSPDACRRAVSYTHLDVYKRQSLSNPFLEGKTDGIEELNTVSAETSLEMIVAQEPDLIVTITEADYEKYAEIAPTVYIQDGKRSDEKLFRYIADLVLLLHWHGI